MSTSWEGAKRAQNRQLKIAFGLFLATCLLFGWKYIVSARSAPQIIERAPLSRPRVVMFDISHEPLEVQTDKVDPIPLANAALYRGLTRERRWDLMSLQARNALLDPAWTTAPTTLEEAVELGRETGADWAIQGKLKRGDDFYRISFKLIALTPKQWQKDQQDLAKDALLEETQPTQEEGVLTEEEVPDDSIMLSADTEMSKDKTEEADVAYDLIKPSKNGNPKI